MEEKKLSLNDKIDVLYNSLDKGKEKKKKLRIPRKAKTSKFRKRRGWAGILFLNENKTISAQKVKLEGGTYRTKDDYIHVTNGRELMFWEGKFPILFQRYDKLNPINLFAKEGDKNEMYGQDLVKLRYKRDLIKEKRKGGLNIVMIIAVIAGGYIIIKMLFPGLFWN